MPLTERDINIPPPARATPSNDNNNNNNKPSLQTPSKLPRRVNAPRTAQPQSHRPRVTLANNNKSLDETKSLRGTTPGLPASRSCQTLGQSTSSASKLLPHEKALPSRPIAHLSTALSPSKDSRCLMDAVEQPLEFTSIAGGRHEWPTLKPTMPHSQSPPHQNQGSSSPFTPSAASSSQDPSSATSTTSNVIQEAPAKSIDAPSSQRAFTPTSMMSAASELTNIITDGRSSQQIANDRSSPSMDYSYQEYSGCHPSSDDDEDSPLDTQSAQYQQAPAYRHNDGTYPPRQASLRSRISSGNLVAAKSGQRLLHGFTDFAKGTGSPGSSRPTSPSPANFSRPRPGSTYTALGSPRSMKTASRIPIPDSKKATVVSVKHSRSSDDDAPRPANAPSFGSRRLDAQHALDVLDHGMKRRVSRLRRMDRTPSDGSKGSLGLRRRSVTPSAVGTMDEPSLGSIESASQKSSLPTQYAEGSTMEGSSGDEDEVTTPPDRVLHYTNQPTHGHEVGLALSVDGEGDASEDFTDEEFIKPSFPPPTSPYAGLLPTIPSEAALPLDGAGLDEEPESNHQVDRALSHLEGHGSPPKAVVDDKRMKQMFGRLKPATAPKTDSRTGLEQSAATAQKFLQMRLSEQSDTDGSGGHTEAHGHRRGPSATRGPSTTRAEGAQSTANNPISKWSASTPSEKEMSPVADKFLKPPVHHPADQPQRAPPPPPKDVATPSPSIGYPSRIPGKSPVGQFQTPNQSAGSPTVPRRQSSPTTDRRKPAITTRTALPSPASGFARTTASVESKKASRVPTPTTGTANRFNVVGNSLRGRGPSGGTPQTASKSTIPTPRAPRSQSKTRNVLDKINGLFSSRRERRERGERHGPPPTTLGSYPDCSDRGPPRADSLTLASAKSPPQLSKMPSWSHGDHPALHAETCATNIAGDATLIEAVGDHEGSPTVQSLSAQLVGKAQRENNTARKERLLSFAKVLNDSLISVREAQISAETAQHAAKSARLSYEMTQKSITMLHKLASSVARSSHRRR